MSVIRVDLDRCTGCGNCAAVCTMDVFYFDNQARKSVLAYPENCQSCGQCVLNCPGRALDIADGGYGYPLTAFRGVSGAPQQDLIF